MHEFSTVFETQNEHHRSVPRLRILGMENAGYRDREHGVLEERTAEIEAELARFDPETRIRLVRRLRTLVLRYSHNQYITKPIS
jgi:DNA-binding GntR family transcriptional regulator